MTNQLRLLLLPLSVAIAGVACGVEANPVWELWPKPSSEAASDNPTAAASAPTSSNEQTFTIGPVSAGSRLDQLESYRANLILDFEGTRGGQPLAGHIETLTEVNRPAAALHQYQNVDATIPNAQNGAGISQFFKVDDKIYISRAGETLQFEAADNQISPGGVGFYELDKLIVLPSTVSNAPQLESRNRLNLLRYSFDQDDLTSSNIVFEQAQGDLWVAVPGNYLIQYVISTSLRIQTPIPNAHLLDEGSLTLSYQLTDINADFLIIPPHDAGLDATPFADFPPLPEAEITALYPRLIEYTSVISPISATLFYQTGLPAKGWTEESAAILNEKSRLTYSKEDQLLTVIIIPADDHNKIKIVLDMAPQR